MHAHSATLHEMGGWAATPERLFDSVIHWRVGRSAVFFISKSGVLLEGELSRAHSTMRRSCSCLKSGVPRGLDGGAAQADRT